MDIVRVFEQWCEDNNVTFAYGSENHLNLIETESAIDSEKIYLLLFPVNRQSLQGTFAPSGQKTYSGKFMLLMSSDYSGHYFDEKGTDKTTSKYTQHIEPLITVFDALEKALSCDGREMQSYSNTDAINVLDANKDGLWCNFTIEY